MNWKHKAEDWKHKAEDWKHKAEELAKRLDARTSIYDEIVMLHFDWPPNYHLNLGVTALELNDPDKIYNQLLQKVKIWQSLIKSLQTGVEKSA